MIQNLPSIVKGIKWHIRKQKDLLWINRVHTVKTVTILKAICQSTQSLYSSHAILQRNKQKVIRNRRCRILEQKSIAASITILDFKQYCRATEHIQYGNGVRTDQWDRRENREISPHLSTVLGFFTQVQLEKFLTYTCDSQKTDTRSIQNGET